MSRLIGVFVTLGVAVFIGSPADATEITGRATVIDGDTLEIHGQRVRLWGIDAPESSQLCFADERAQRCGQQAALRLVEFIGNAPVSCIQVDTDRYRRPVAVCAVGERDLADWLVREGLAIDFARYSDGEYASAQRDAAAARRGIWATSFVEPGRFRACMREAGGRPEACSVEQARAAPKF